MIAVVDASALVEFATDTPLGAVVSKRLAVFDVLHAPDIFDFEVLAAIRRVSLQALINERDAQLALFEFSSLTIRRAASAPHLTRAFELRHSVSAGDALYVSLAEVLGCPLVTTDGRLARSHGHDAEIQWIR